MDWAKWQDILLNFGPKCYKCYVYHCVCVWQQEVTA